MQKRIYTKDLSLDEILKRLVNDEIMYLNDGDEAYIKKESDALVQYENNKLTIINPAIFNGDEDNYFLDEVEEPEADESCIGKLCYFWNEEDDEKEIGFLGEIDKEHNFPFAMGFGYSGVGYKHCRALTKEEVMKYIKE